MEFWLYAMEVLLASAVAKCWKSPDSISGWLPWWWLTGWVGFDEISINKRGGATDAGVSACSRCLGGGVKEEMPGSRALREDFEAATCRGHQRRRGCAAIFLGQRGHSVLRCVVHLSLFLLAGVPNGRIISSFVAAFIAGPSPSGSVPGDGASGCGVELIVTYGGEGPDCFFPLSLWGSFCKS